LVKLIRLNLDKHTLQILKQLAGSIRYDFLRCTLDLETATITDTIAGSFLENVSKKTIQVLSDLFTHYASGEPTPLSGKLVKFKDVPGGYAYEAAFVKRAIEPIAEAFGREPEELVRAAKLLGGIQLELGDASVEVTALTGIPLTYILWRADEFAASATILYDESARNYLPTEDLASLGEITTSRLIEIKEKTFA
jgi:hypothetical protein